MARSYFIPGMRASQREEGKSSRTPMPDLYAEQHDYQLGEWLRSRDQTSHQEVGLQRGDKITFTDVSGERRPAIVDHEERDQHTGKIDVHFHASDATGSGSYVQTFEGDTARSLHSSKTKRTFD